MSYDLKKAKVNFLSCRFFYSQTILPDDIDDGVDMFNPKHVKEQKERIKKVKMEKIKSLDLKK